MVRVAGLRGQVREGVAAVSQEGLSPQEQLTLINQRALELMEEQQRCWRELTPLMRKEGVCVANDDDIDEADAEWLENEFNANIFPVLTPLALDPAHPFPFIPNLGFVLCFELKKTDGEIMQALLPVPINIGRFIRLPDGPASEVGRTHVRFIALEKVIVRFINQVFPGFEIVAHGSYRVLRDSDVEIEEEAEDLVRVFETMLKRRRRGDVIRVKVDSKTPTHLRDLIRDRLQATSQDIILVDGLLGLAQTNQLIPSDRPDLQFEPFEPRFPERIREHGGDCFPPFWRKTSWFIIHMNLSMLWFSF